MLHLVLVLACLVAAPAGQARRMPIPRSAPALQERVAAPIVLEGGRPRARALLIALHGGSFSGAEPLQLAERCRDELSAAAREAGLRLLVPVAPDEQASLSLGARGGPALHGGAPERTARGPPGVQPGIQPGIQPGAHQVPWLLPAGEARVLGLIEAELAARRADAARIYLAGRGAGATGALLLAARHATRIAGVAAWSGTPPPLWDAERRVVGLAEDPVAGLAGVPVYLWTARDDTLLDRAVLELFTAGLRAGSSARGPRRLLVEDETGGHGYGEAGPGTGLRFLRAQRLRPAR
jgi:hypothetical protein